MFRLLEEALAEWKTSASRKPLLIRGARQVGKSYLIEKFGREHFENTILVNFEFDERFKSCFSSLDPLKIINALEAIVRKPIVAGSSLLFLDEIQECPNAILALRYFKEKMPDLHVIGAGSLLEFVLNDAQYHKPVGRIQSYYLHPCSFYEFLRAQNEQRLLDYLAKVTLSSTIQEPYHQLLLERCREYCAVGGMPEVMKHYKEQPKLLDCQMQQASLFEQYQKDFPKYNVRVNSKALQKIFSKAPLLVAQHFKYVDVDSDIQAKTQKPALEALIDSGLIHLVRHTTAAGLPLNNGVHEKKFKLLFLDIGLVSYVTRVDISTLLNEDLILINKGNLAEQFVGQELIAYSNYYEKPELYFWQREKLGAQAEVDYVLQYRSTLFPIEVKAGKTGRLKSLRIFMEEKKVKAGIHISQQPFGFKDNILSLPLYMIHELPRLLDELLEISLSNQL